MSNIKVQGNVSGTGSLTIAAPNTNTDRTLSLPDESGTLLSSGGPISGTTGTFTGLMDISAAGAGQIKFPATQNASSNGNTLDDYEEGTFTATFVNGTFTYGAQTGNYIKIGKFVFVQVFIGWSAKSGSGQLAITLPFTVSTSRTAGAFGYCAGLGTGAAMLQVAGGNTNVVSIIYMNAGGTSSGVDVSGISGSGELQFTTSYITSS